MERNSFYKKKSNTPLLNIMTKKKFDGFTEIIIETALHGYDEYQNSKQYILFQLTMGTFKNNHHMRQIPFHVCEANTRISNTEFMHSEIPNISKINTRPFIRS